MDTFGHMPNRSKLVKQGEPAPPAPKQKRLERRRERHEVRNEIKQFFGCQIMPADADYYDEEVNDG